MHDGNCHGTAYTGVLLQFRDKHHHERDLADEYPRTYEIMDPSDVGVSESLLVLGKLSGRNALRSKLEKLGYHVEGEKLDQVSIRVKQVLDTQRAVSDVQLHEICAEVFRSTNAAVAS